MTPNFRVCFRHGRAKKVSGAFLLKEQTWRELLLFARRAKEAGASRIALRDTQCPDCGETNPAKEGRTALIFMCLHHGRLHEKGTLMQEQSWDALKRLMARSFSNGVLIIVVEHRPCPDCDQAALNQQPKPLAKQRPWLTRGGRADRPSSFFVLTKACLIF